MNRCLFITRPGRDASGPLDFSPSLDSSRLRIHNCCGSWWEGLKLASASVGLQSKYLPSILLLCPFSLMLDVHQACLEGGCKPKTACSWVRPEHRTPPQANSSHPHPSPEDSDAHIPMSAHL